MFIYLALISCICPIVGIPITIQKFSARKNVKECAVLIGLSFSAMLYGYIADAENDIYRHFENLFFYEDISFFQCFNANVEIYNTLFIWDIWQWIIAQFNNPYLLQASGALVGYTLLSYLVFDYSKCRGLSTETWITAFIILLLITSPLSFSIGIRGRNAYIICSLAFYLFFIRKKSYSLCLIILFIAFFLHHSVIIVIVFWLTYTFFSKNPLLFILGLIFVMISFNNYESYIGYFFSGVNMSLMEKEFEKTVVAYIDMKNNSLHYIISSTILRLFTICFFARGLGFGDYKELLHHPFKMRNENLHDSLSFFSHSLLFFVFLIISQLSYNGERYISVLVPMISISFMNSIEIRPFLKTRNIFFLDISLLFLTFLIFIINLYDLNWGTASLFSLMVSSFTGYFSRMIM